MSNQNGNPSDLNDGRVRAKALYDDMMKAMGPKDEIVVLLWKPPETGKDEEVLIGSTTRNKPLCTHILATGNVNHIVGDPSEHIRSVVRQELKRSSGLILPSGAMPRA